MGGGTELTMTATAEEKIAQAKQINRRMLWAKGGIGAGFLASAFAMVTYLPPHLPDGLMESRASEKVVHLNKDREAIGFLQEQRVRTKTDKTFTFIQDQNGQVHVQLDLISNQIAAVEKDVKETQLLPDRYVGRKGLSCTGVAFALLVLGAFGFNKRQEQKANQKIKEIRNNLKTTDGFSDYQVYQALGVEPL